MTPAASIAPAANLAPTPLLAAYLNWAHTLDHLFMLIFPTAAIALTREWSMGYAELIKLSIGGWVAFGVFSIPAGWLADKWSRWGMMVVFFVGIGLASIAAGLSQGPAQMAIALTAIGMFAAIYHPVGIAMLTMGARQLGKTLGINGVWGNSGLAFAALLTGALIDFVGWRWAFIVPGVLAVVSGIGFAMTTSMPQAKATKKSAPTGLPRSFYVRVFAVLAVVAAGNSVIFNATTISMPKIFDERLNALTNTSLGIGALVCFTYLVAAMAQLLVGYWIDRGGLKRVLVPVVAFQVPLLFLAGIFSDYALLFIAVGMMFFVFGQIPINDAMVARYTADEWRARALGLRYVLSFTAGTLAVSLIAFSQTHGGFTQLFNLLAVGAAVVLVAALAFPGAPVKAG